MNTGIPRMDQRSEARLEGVHPDLVKLIREVAKQTDQRFVITEGLRTAERQKQLVAAGASQTMNSRHLSGHAVDVAIVIDGEIRWDWPLYERFSVLMKSSAAALGIDIVWGGDWKMRDGPHYELDRKKYPQKR